MNDAVELGRVHHWRRSRLHAQLAGLGDRERRTDTEYKPRGDPRVEAGGHFIWLSDYLIT